MWHTEAVLSLHLPGVTGEYHSKTVRVALTFFPAIQLLINIHERYVRTSHCDKQAANLEIKTIITAFDKAFRKPSSVNLTITVELSYTSC